MSLLFLHSYALEKFSCAIHDLSVGAGDVRSRLLTVFRGSLYTITNNHLPEQHHQEWTWVKKEIVKFSESWPGQRADWEKLYKSIPFKSPSPLEATMRRIKNRTGRKIAEKIFSIWSTLDSEYRDWKAR